MSTTLTPPNTRHLRERHARLFAGITALLAAAGCAIAIAELNRSGEVSFSERSAPTPAEAWPGELTAREQAAVSAALESRDARTRALAGSVAAGEAGASALGDPGILYHHGLDTGAVPDGERARTDRYHHR